MDINTKIQIVANQHNRSLVSKYTGFFVFFLISGEDDAQTALDKNCSISHNNGN